jgi:hypothetical protein
VWSVWALVAPTLAQVELGVVQVDASPLGPNYVTADVFISVPDPADWWTVGGIAGGPLANGLAHWIYNEPNTQAFITAPGNDTPQAEFATFVSLPRDQFSNKRFGPNGAASVVGGYSPPAPSAAFGGDFINIAFIEFPPATDGVRVPDFGFIARVTLENSPAISGFGTDDIFVAESPAAGILLAEYQVASATRLHPAPLSEFTFGFYAIPEPASLVLLLTAGIARRRV